MKLWGGRFTKQTDKLVESFTASIGFDQRLAVDDIRGSLAHVKMLGACGIIPQQDADRIAEGLRSILADVKAERFPFLVENEDVHMNIEKHLIERIGPVGGKLHTGRSRNDQVATDMHLYLRRETKQIIALLVELQQILIEIADANIDVIIPGYTHMQRAQPVLFAHHMLAYFGMFSRDIERLQDVLKRIDILPLGAGAMAGTTFPIDRELVARELGFARIYENSMDAVSDRDFILEFLSAASITMMHISRFCEELILWSSQEFGFVELDDGYSTGSSIMPQKKNPDVAELLRGKTGRVYGDLFGLLTILKGLPLTYNKDLQEDKEGMFDAVDTLKGSVVLLGGMIRTMVIRREHLAQTVKEDFSNATDLADYLVRKGLPFRQAHEVIGKLVLYCIEQGKFLNGLTLDEYVAHSELFGTDVFEAIDIRTVVDARDVHGGTGTKRVMKAIQNAKERTAAMGRWIEDALQNEDMEQ
ncbi:argininosuccinate lyase [Gordoniibacillus kamchatkensis]|uniref:Argininosuccinate lyase n=1 Tax=Gordoniibacillus kamchatkensis TaxID=1590651 RepID=A0ABR5ADF0_9BACL|nr:argininosuccinate lyase [Paenibacillus sp. VKM B-2647]KIL39032.1 argininosuccinate lyase [Paenibacillus sp. VKM B-2647]